MVFNAVRTWRSHLSALGGSVESSQEGIVITGLETTVARTFVRRYFLDIGSSLNVWEAPKAIVEPSDGGKRIVIPQGFPAEIDTEDDDIQTLYTALMGFDRAVLKVINERMDHPLQGAIVRLKDGLQIVVCDPERTFYPDPLESVQHRRADYWYAPDLERLHQEMRDNSRFTLTYLADDFPGANDWSRITTEFVLFHDRRGRQYHNCFVKGFEELGALNL